MESKTRRKNFTILPSLPLLFCGHSPCFCIETLVLSLKNVHLLRFEEKLGLGVLFFEGKFEGSKNMKNERCARLILVVR